MTLPIPSIISPISGITKIIDYIKGFLNIIGNWFADLPIMDLWEDFFPNDISAVIEIFIAMMIALAILGIIRKFLVIFG